MRIKRVLQGTALTALAAAAWMSAGTVDASAAEATDFPIDRVVGISTSGAITINTKEAGYKEIMFGVASYNQSKGVKLADTAWDVYEPGNSESISIDLSKLSLTKDNYIAIKSESTNPIYLKVSASVSKQKVKYDASTHKLTIDVTKAGAADTNTVKWEYRTTYGSWCDFDKNNKVFTEYEPQGATLYVRAKAEAKNRASSTVKDATDKAGTRTFPLYDLALMPGKESKVNIKKMANGPSVSANYATGEVKIPNNTEYRVIANDCDISKNADGSGTSITIRDLLNLSDESKVATSGTIEVRKKATTTKPASKWTRVDIAIPAAPVFTMVEGRTATDGALDVVDGIKVEPIKNTKGGKNEYSGKVNITAGSYDISVKIEGATKPITIKKGVTKKNVSVAADKKISIAKAGNKTNKEWIGDYADICTVK